MDHAPATVYHINGEPAAVINGTPGFAADSSLSSQLDICSDSVLSCDPCFGEWIEGRDVRKFFGNKCYSGKVSKFDGEMNWYRVIYEDGDFEDLYWHELEEVLVPFDISIPLKKLALQILQHHKSSGESGESSKISSQCLQHVNSSKRVKSRRIASSKKLKCRFKRKA